MNVKRLARRNRDWWDRANRVVMAACADRIITPREVEEIADAFTGGKALGAVVDLNDCRGRATSKDQLDALNRETSVWLERLPEAA